MMDKETFDREFYPNIVIRTIETKLAMAENRKQNEMFVTLDVMHDILSMLKEQQKVIEQYHRADGFLDVHGWKW